MLSFSSKISRQLEFPLPLYQFKMYSNFRKPIDIPLFNPSPELEIKKINEFKFKKLDLKISTSTPYKLNSCFYLFIAAVLGSVCKAFSEISNNKELEENKRLIENIINSSQTKLIETNFYDPQLCLFNINPNDYQEQLLSHLIEHGKNCDENFRRKKIIDLVNCVSNGWLDKGNPKFNTQIIKSLCAIASIRPGRKLLKQLYNLNPSFKIKEGESGGIFDSYKNCIIVGLKNSSITFIQTNEKIKVQPISFNLTLAHELIHALHCAESKENHIKDFENRETLNDEFTNVEEQITISGIKNQKLQYPICENLFRLAWGEPLRISHKGFEIDSEENLTIRNWIDIYLQVNKLDTRTQKNTINFCKKFENVFAKSVDKSEGILYAFNNDALLHLLFKAGAQITPNIIMLEPSLIKFAPHLLEREDILIAYFNKEPHAFLSISEEKQNCKIFVSKALAVQPKLLQFLSPKMLDDEKIVRIALSQPNSRDELFLFASHRLRNDITFVSEFSDKFLKYASKEFLDNKDFMLKNVQKLGRNLKFASEKLRDDETLAFEAVKGECWALKYVSERLRDDFNIVWTAVHHGGWALESAGPNMKDNKKIVLEAIKSDHKSINFASPRLQKDPTIIIAAEESEKRYLEKNTYTY